MPRRPSKPEHLPVVLVEEDGEGGTLTRVRVPFPVERKPFVPWRLHKTLRPAIVRIANLVATQDTVTTRGIHLHAHPREDERPVVYLLDDRAFIADGHHRATAAYLRGDEQLDVMALDVPAESPKARRASIEKVVDRLRREDWQATRTGGLADGMPIRSFPRAALVEGAAVELEHTGDIQMAIRIAMDHLVEDLDYYPKLAKMEAAMNPSTSTSIAIPDAAMSVIEVDVRELAADPEGYGLDDEERRALQAIANAVRGRRLVVDTSDKETCEIVGSKLMDLANGYDDQAIHGPEDLRRFARNASRGLGTMAGKVWRACAKKNPRDQAVAQRDRTRRTMRNPLGSGQTFEVTYPAYKAVYEDTLATVSGWAEQSGMSLQKFAQIKHIPSNSGAFDLYIIGRHLAELTLAERAIPPRKQKSFEKAVREFNRSRRPDNWTKWFVRTLPSIRLLLEADSWKPVGEVPSTVIRIGEMQIVNQTGRDAEASVKLMQAASDAIASSDIPNAIGLLYGNVYVVGNVQRKRGVGGVYFPGSDDIQLILVSRFETTALKSLIHEFGHRYWQKLLPQRYRTEWRVYHDTLSDQPVDLPPPGERALAVKDEPIVTGYDAGRMYMDGGGWVSVDAYVATMRRRAFPTQYASTDAEEHFCDAFAMYCLGSLKEPHRASFESLIVRDQTRDLRTLQAARRIAQGGR